MNNRANRLVIAMRDLHRSWMEISPKAEINKSQFFTLKSIKNFPKEHPDAIGATVKDLASKSFRSSASISQKISFLEGQGLVSRRHDSSDKRIVYFNLTEKGEQVYDSIEENMQIFMDRVIEKLGEDDVDEITEKIEKLQKCIKDTMAEITEVNDETV